MDDDVDRDGASGKNSADQTCLTVCWIGPGIVVGQIGLMPAEMATCHQLLNTYPQQRNRQPRPLIPVTSEKTETVIRKNPVPGRGVRLNSNNPTEKQTRLLLAWRMLGNEASFRR